MPACLPTTLPLRPLPLSHSSSSPSLSPLGVDNWRAWQSIIHTVLLQNLSRVWALKHCCGSSVVGTLSSASSHSLLTPPSSALPLYFKMNLCSPQAPERLQVRTLVLSLLMSLFLSVPVASFFLFFLLPRFYSFENPSFCALVAVASRLVLPFTA